MLPRAERTTLALSVQLLASAARLGPITDAMVSNLLIFRTPLPPEPMVWKVARQGSDSVLLVSNLGHCMVRHSGPAVVTKLPTSPYPKTRGYLNDVRGLLDCHRAVAEAFLPPPPSDRHVVRHLNSLPDIYHANNLAWGTRAENTADQSSDLYGVYMEPPKVEQWRYHPRYAGLYVSNWGSFQTRYFELVAADEVYGYRKLTFESFDLGKKTENVHRLVYEAFHGPTANFVCHKDGNRQNNRMDNLYAGTGRENARDRGMHGRTARGEQHVRVHLSDRTALKAIRRCLAGVPIRKVARSFGVHPGTLQAWVTGRNRAYLVECI